MNTDIVSKKLINKWHSISEKKWMLILALLVFLANIQIYWVQIPVADDSELYYRLHLFKTPFTGFVVNLNYLNSFLSWVAAHVDLFLARSIILICILIPMILLLFRILRKLGYPLPVSFFSAGLMGFMPGQINIPIFVNGSYIVDAMFFMLIAFWAGLKFFEKEDGSKWVWFAFSLITFYYALRVSELVASVAATIIFCFICWRHFDLKAWVLSASFALLTLYHVYFNIIQNGRRITTQAKPLSFEELSKVFQKFITWSFPRIYIPETAIYEWAMSVAAICGVCLVIGVIRGFNSETELRVIKKRHFSRTGAYIWRIIFPILWVLLSLIVMTFAPYYVTRHAFFSALGLYLCLSFILFEAVKKYSRTTAIALLLILMLGSMIAHYKTVYNRFLPMNADHEEFLRFAREEEYPPQAQIVLFDLTAIGSTVDGLWWRSSGYLRYALKRSDISGLIGSELMLSDPFKDATYNRGGMDGLNLFEPLFLYRKRSSGFEQLSYFLHWQGNNVNSNFTIYKTDQSSGKITKLIEGKGLKAYVKELDTLEKIGVSRSDIVWGGEPSQRDLQSLAHNSNISEPRKSKWQNGFYISEGVLEEGGIGFVLSSDKDKTAVALKKTDMPYKNIVTIKGQIKAALTSGVRNGFIVFGENRSQLVKAGVLIGANTLVIQGPYIEEVKKPQQFDQSKVLDTELIINLRENTVTWKVDGTEIKTRMKTRPSSINYVGYSAWSTKTEFSELRRSGS